MTTIVVVLLINAHPECKLAANVAKLIPCKPLYNKNTESILQV